MKQVYGEFCSRHSRAVSFFKDLQQHNKRFQSFIKVLRHFKDYYRCQNNKVAAAELKLFVEATRY